ncbi:MAG: hypothetical protein EB168_11245, partial [Euryarchaeota archaeon]|nr:hypothetical protein [Euryarchaeota archaeon]
EELWHSVTGEPETSFLALQPWPALEESALDSVVNDLQRARELTIQANNASMTAQDRRAIAVELSAILESIIDWMENNEWFATGVTVNKRSTSLAQQARQNPELRERLIAERNRGMCQ